MSKANNGKLLRKYKIFFIIGLIILIFQVLLVARFLELNNKTQYEDDWQPQSQQPPSGNIITSQNEQVSKKQQQKQPKLNNSSVTLRLHELEFTPNCEITRKEAVSAIHRAKTQQCKQIIANVTCQSLAGDLYPKNLQGECPSAGFVAGKPLGCFKDENNFRLLTGYFGVNDEKNSPEFCIKLCLQSGFQYAGVQYSNECFCGNEEPVYTSKLPDSSCNMKCPGDAHATCGGYYTINIFQTGIKSFLAKQANVEPPTAEEPPARIVFLLTLHGRALRQVKRLLKILYHEHHFYYIHVDIREDYLFRELLPLETQFKNIKLTRSRFATIWGGASLLTMLLHCMNELLRLEWPWDFVINLSESDYPVKKITHLQHFLTANKNNNFVKSHGRETQRFLQKQGLDKTFVECEKRMWRVANRQLPANIQMDGGSDWVALSRPFVEYVAAAHPDSLVSGLLQVYKFTLLPAESFFHTVLRNSRFCESYIDNNLHVTNWKRKLGCKCQYKHIVDWCGCSPNDFKLEDWARIQSTEARQLYFARKFEPVINQAVLLKLELFLFNLEEPSRRVENLHSYWQSIYHFSDLSPRLEDSLGTLFNSILRIWKRNCQLHQETSPVLETTSFHHRDTYRNTLIKFKFNKSEVIEIAFKPTSEKPANRVKELFVSSDYDQKEQISRNFPRVVGPYTEPLLVYNFKQGTSANFTCLWTNPVGAVTDQTEISVDENQLLGFSKASLKLPLLPGIWSVYLLEKERLFSEVRFVVIPLETYSGREITEKQANLIHGTFTKRTNEETYKFIKKESNVSEVVKNARKTGRELEEWIDSLVSLFYTIESACVSGGKREVCGVRVEECLRSNWSSLAPDPKSAIGRVNATSGVFDIW